MQWGLLGELGRTFEEEEDVELVNWLQHNRESDKVKEYMRRTAKSRYMWIRTNDRPSVQEIFQRYPRLLDDGMVEQDFEETVSGDDKFFTLWPKLAPKILEYGVARVPSWYSYLNVEANDYEDLIGFTQDEKEVLAFSMLPLICRGQCRGKRGKCSFKESLEVFIDFKPEGTDLEFYISNIDRKQKPQPFILLLGGSRMKPLQVFVIVERKQIAFDTLHKAVDFAFKLHYVIDINYQPQCQAAWQFLQSVAYKIPGDVRASSVIEMRTYLSLGEEQ